MGALISPHYPGILNFFTNRRGPKQVAAPSAQCFFSRCALPLANISVSWPAWLIRSVFRARIFCKCIAGSTAIGNCSSAHISRTLRRAVLDLRRPLLYLTTAPSASRPSLAIRRTARLQFPAATSDQEARTCVLESPAPPPARRTRQAGAGPAAKFWSRSSSVL